MRLPGLLTPCFCNYEKNGANLPTETGFDRLKRMFLKNEYGTISPEMYYLVNNATSTFIATSFLGALIHANKAKNDYIRQNVASTYESEYFAKRHLSDSISLSAIKGGLKYGVKYGSFSSLYLLLTISIANYNNKITIWEHIGTGALIGSMFRINFGLKGMAVAGGLGSFLGAFAGGVLVLFMRYNNATLQDLRDWQAERYFASIKERSRKLREKEGLH